MRAYDRAVPDIPISPIDTTLSASWGRSPDGAVEEGPVLVDEGDLVRWLSAQFQTYPGCSAVSVERVVRMDRPDAQGCNWSRTLVLNPGGTPPEAYAVAYAAIVEMGRSAFNLKVEESPGQPA